jgi:hypothetical protein
MCQNEMLPKSVIIFFGWMLLSRLRRIEPLLTEIVRIMRLQPRAKKTDHSNWGRPTLTRFRLPTVCNNVVRGVPRYLWRAS